MTKNQKLVLKLSFFGDELDQILVLTVHHIASNAYSGAARKQNDCVGIIIRTYMVDHSNALIRALTELLARPFLTRLSDPCAPK